MKKFLRFNSLIAILSVVFLSFCTPSECKRYKESACKDTESEICKAAEKEYTKLEPEVCIQKTAEIDSVMGMDKLDQFFEDEQ